MGSVASTTTAADVITGIGVSPGQAVGAIAVLPPPVPEPPAGAALGTDDDVAAAAGRVATAAATVETTLRVAASRATGTARDVLETTAQMAADPTLVAAAQALVTERRADPARAVWEAAADVMAQLAAVGGYLAERVVDVADVRDRIVAALTGRPAPGVPQLGRPVVLVATDLAPADTATLDPSLVLAIVTAGGGPTSHTAILARALGIPAVVGAAGVLAVPPGTTVLVDGGAGVVVPEPSDEQQALATHRPVPRRVFDGRGRTADGHPVALLANLGRPGEARAAAEAGAEGVGLLRTEVGYLDRAEPPTVAEQVAGYREVLAAFPGRKVVIRTLDAGADKPLPFLSGGAEPNPALGVRGLRAAGRRPDVLEDQLAAIAEAAAAEDADAWVMAPMVSTVDEAEAFVARCRAHGLRTAGVMVEVPSAALLAGAILARADFASIGTNDLTQYVMAADRQVAELAALATPWQPAVLQLVAATCAGGSASGRPVGVCGEAAADPALAVVLVGLGVGSLSMTPRALGDVAAVLASVTAAECRGAAGAALAAESAEGARAAARAALPVLGELGL